MKANIKIVTEIKEISELLKFAKQNFIVGEKQVFSQKEIKSDKLYYFDEKLLTSQEALSNLIFLVLKTDNKIAGSICYNTQNNRILFFIVEESVLKIEIAYFLFTYFLRLVTVRPKFSTDKLYIDAFLSQTPLYKALGFVQTKDCYLDEKSGVVMMPMLFNISEIDNESSSL